jgi:hypothetical protein
VTTHNEGGQGRFSLFDTLLVQDNSTASTSPTPLMPLYTYTNATNPFSPVGFFHNPEEGYYDSDTDAGVGNRNDIFIWGFDTNTLSGTNVTTGDGQIFGFQFPIGYNPDTDSSGDLSVLFIGSTRNLQAATRPILTNYGRSMYWAHTRSTQRCWVGESDLNRRRFSRSDTKKIRLARRRGGTPWMASQAPPTLSSDPVMPVVYGPGASTEFFRFNHNYSQTLVVSTDSYISSRAVITPDDLYVFYGTEGGILYQADGTDLTTVWNSSGVNAILLDGIYGDLAIHPSGSHVYVGDNSGTGFGNIIAIQIARITASSTTTGNVTANAVTVNTTNTSTIVQTQAKPTIAPVTLAPTATVTSFPTSTPLNTASTGGPSTMVPTLVPTPAASPSASVLPTFLDVVVQAKERTLSPTTALLGSLSLDISSDASRMAPVSIVMTSLVYLLLMG